MIDLKSVLAAALRSVVVVASCARASALPNTGCISHTIVGRAQAQRWHCTAAAALVVERAPPEPTLGYGSVAPCERSNRRALAAAQAWCRRRGLMSRDRAAGHSAASCCIVRCSAVGVVLSHRPQSTVPVTSAPTADLGPLGTSRVVVGGRYATKHENDRFPATQGCRSS